MSLKAELMEQARLNGMGAERELALMAKLERAERDFFELFELVLALRPILERATHEAEARMDNEGESEPYFTLKVLLKRIDKAMKGKMKG